MLDAQEQDRFTAASELVGGLKQILSAPLFQFPRCEV